MRFRIESGRSIDGGDLLATLTQLIPFGVVAGRDDQTQNGPAGRLERELVPAAGGRASNLGSSRDKRHLLLVFHDLTT